MNYRMPSYYRDFKCIADKCPDTCCAGWEIVIDDKTMEKYKSMQGDMGKYILSNVDQKENVYKRCGNRCAFLNDNNLCDLYIKAGEDKFCKTCDRYPRHFEEYGNLLEAAISMSCPVAARMIIDREDVDSFKIKTNSKPALNNDVDNKLLSCLLDVRKVIFDILKDRNISLNDRMIRILTLGEMVQPFIYEYEKLGYKKHIPYLKNRILQNIKSILIEKKWLKKSEEYSKNVLDSMQKSDLMHLYLDMFLGLENINEKWPVLIEEVIEILYEKISPEEYINNKTKFNQYMRDREYEYEHILVYFIYTYFLGGVYDYNIQGMIKFAVISTLIIKEIGISFWIKNGKEFSVEEQVKIAYTYSRQVEHSDNNLMSIEGILTAHPLFAEEKIAILL